jgi:hypothetical protein
MSADAVRLSLPQSRFRLRLRGLGRAREESPLEPVAARPLELAELLAPERWAPLHRVDPELRKALGVIQGHLSETRRLLAVAKASAPLRDTAALRELTSLVRRDVATLDIDSAWDLAGALKRLNLRFADCEFVNSRLEYEERRATARQWHGWNTHFDADELVALLKVFAFRTATLADHARAVDRLTFLYLQREEAGRDRRARAALKRMYLTRLTPVMLLLLAGFALAVNVATGGHIWEKLLLSLCAGGLGSTVSGIFKVRDQLVRLDELRSFGPAMRVQPLIGACAGLILFLVLQSHAIALGSAESGGWSGLGLLAFVAGFSEPFFLGIVQRVAVVSDRPADETPRKSER